MHLPLSLHPTTLLRRTFKTLSFFSFWIYTQESLFSWDRTSGASALPTLNFRGDVVLTNKLYKWGRGVQVGDFVAIRHPSFVYTGMGKRVAGLPGDYVVVGEAVGVDSSGREGGDGDGVRMMQVPEGHCWLIGDNMPHSRDSRFFGPVPLALIEGKMVARLWPSPKWIRNTLEPVTFKESI